MGLFACKQKQSLSESKYFNHSTRKWIFGRMN